MNTTSHCRCAIQANTKDLRSPHWTDNVEDARDEAVHIVCSVSLKHRDCENMDVEYIILAMDSNAIVEIGVAIVSGTVVRKRECPCT